MPITVSARVSISKMYIRVGYPGLGGHYLEINEPVLEKAVLDATKQATAGALGCNPGIDWQAAHNATLVTLRTATPFYPAELRPHVQTGQVVARLALGNAPPLRIVISGLQRTAISVAVSSIFMGICPTIVQIVKMSR